MSLQSEVAAEVRSWGVEHPERVASDLIALLDGLWGHQRDEPAAEARA